MSPNDAVNKTPMVVIGTRYSARKVIELDKIARARRVPRADVIRDALDRVVAEVAPEVVDGGDLPPAA